MVKRFRPGALGVYVGSVVGCGVAAVLVSLRQLPRTPHPVGWILLGACALLTGTFRVKIASVSASISVSDTFFITSAMLFGPAPATVALAVDSAVMSWRLRHPANRLAFNAIAPAISMWVAAHLFFRVAGIPPVADAAAPSAALVGPLLVLTSTYFALNSGLTALAVALETGQSAVTIWRRHFLWLSVGYFAAGSVSLCLTMVIAEIGFTAVAIVVPLLAVFHLTLRASFGRLDDARKHLADLDRLYVSTVETLAMAIDAKDDVTHSHVRRVQTYALGLARALGIGDEPTLKAIEAAALLHDTGKLAVPEHILNKPGKLTPAEFEQMKLHVDVGAQILSGIDFPFPVVPIVRCHHENWDGSGYPRGVTGDAIPIGARILSVVDCFDALTSDRPYRRRMTTEAALAILRERRGTMYDPRVVDMFIEIHAELADLPLVKPTMDYTALQAATAQAESAAASQPAPAAALDERIGVFASLARLPGGSGRLADVLSVASALLADVAPGATIAWYVYDASTDRLEARHVNGAAAGAVAGTWIAVGDRLSGWVAAQRRPALNSDPALDLGDRAGSVHAPLRSCVSVPLANGPALAGVLTLYSPEPDAFTEQVLRHLQAIAPFAADAIAIAAPGIVARPVHVPEPIAAGFQTVH